MCIMKRVECSNTIIWEENKMLKKIVNLDKIQGSTTFMGIYLDLRVGLIMNYMWWEIREILVY